jgi:hypothetical protein
MTRDELIEAVAQDMTESIDLDSLIEFYYESTVHFLDSLDDDDLAEEYRERFDEEVTL